MNLYKFGCLVVTIVIVFVAAAGAATPAVVSTAVLNLRSGPGQAFQIVSTLRADTSLVVLAENGDWKQVVTALGQTGWVFGQFVVPEATFVTVSQSVTVKVSTLNVRQGPSTSYPIITVASQGSVLEVRGRFGAWLQVQVGERIGFVHSDFVGEAKPTEASDTMPIARVNVRLLNLRSGSGTQFPVVARLPNGTLVAVLAEGTWARVMLENGAIGFVASAFLQEVDGKAHGRITATVVNQRSGPGTTFPVLASHARGQVLPITGLIGDWVKVNASGGAGFILGSLLSISFASGESAAVATVPTVSTDLSRFAVVIDPGHGGRDPGAIAASGLRESDINLTMSHKLRARLEAAGATVIMTRTTDVGLSLAERVARANESGADLLVSIHNNAHTNRNISGTQTFHGVTEGSFTLALGVHRRLVALGLVDRNVLTANFGVLQRTTIPAILTETAFLSNAENAALLAQESFVDQAVEAHFEAISEWLLSSRRTRTD